MPEGFFRDLGHRGSGGGAGVEASASGSCYAYGVFQTGIDAVSLEALPWPKNAWRALRAATARALGAAAAARPGRREQGWALISVLWVTAMLGMMAAATQDLTVTSVRAERSALIRAHLDTALDAAIVRAIVALDDTRIDRRWRIDGTPNAFSFGGVDMAVAIQDEDGKIDINEADDTTIQALFEAVGVDTKTANAVTARIVEWRTQTGSVDEHELNGGTDADYAAHGLPWRPRHDEFHSVGEINLVLGMTPALYDRVAPSFTVYSKNDTPDPNVAPRLVLEALYPDDPGQVQKIMTQRAGSYFPGQNGANTSGLAIVATGSDLSGRAFGITVAANYEGRHITRRAVVELTGDDARPYLVEEWE